MDIENTPCDDVAIEFRHTGDAPARARFHFMGDSISVCFGLLACERVRSSRAIPVRCFYFRLHGTTPERDGYPVPVIPAAVQSPQYISGTLTKIRSVLSVKRMRNAGPALAIDPSGINRNRALYSVRDVSRGVEFLWGDGVACEHQIQAI